MLNMTSTELNVTFPKKVLAKLIPTIAPIALAALMYGFVLCGLPSIVFYSIRP